MQTKETLNYVIFIIYMFVMSVVLRYYHQQGEPVPLRCRTGDDDIRAGELSVRLLSS